MENAVPFLNKQLKLICAALILCFVHLLACLPQEEKENIEHKSPFLNVYGAAEYVGSVSCENCHAQQHATYIHTGMGQSFDTASKVKSFADFKNAYIYDSINDLHYKAFWNGEEMMMTEYRLKGADTIHKRTEKISYIIGSGHHTNSHFWMDNGYVYQAPMTWYVQEERWGLPPGYEKNNVRFSRKIEMECMSCHNSLPTMNKQATHKYIDIPKGISCERCHGPGSIHVKEKMKGIMVDTKNEADYTIVNPKRLPWELQIDICQRCHLQGNAVLKPGKSFEDFRPGMPLSDIMQVYLPVYDNPNHPFVMASHAERFKMSECFTQSNTDSIGKYNPDMNFTCINCHNPHVSVRETNISKFNSECSKCHGGKDELQLCSAPKVDLDKANNNCVECHMPLTGSADIPHVAIHDHYIRKPKEYIKEEGKLVGLKSINGGENGDKELLKAYLTYFEKFDSKTFYSKQADKYAKKVGVEEFNPLNVHYWYNKQNYKKVVSLAKEVDVNMVDNHFTAYQIAQSLYNELEYSQSLKWYNRSLSLKPLNVEYRIAKTQVLLELNKAIEAQKELDFIFKEQNKNSQAYYLRGILMLQKGSRTRAKQNFIEVLKLNPDDQKAKAQLKSLAEL